MSLQDKLKVFFKKNASAPLSTRNELSVTPELERELGPEAPLHRRIRALKDLGEKALKYRIHEGDVNKLWCCTRDLLDEGGTGGAGGTEGRHAALSFLRCVAEGQAEHLSLSRTLLFSYLTRTHAQRPLEDEVLRFKLLHTLTNTGKNITSFEEQIGPFLVEWLPQIHNNALSIEMLQLIMNVVKFNASYLDEEVVHSIVMVTCRLCEQCAEPAPAAACLALLEAVLSYSLLPRASLDTFVITLCRTVNLEHCSRTSWKLMRYVLNADMGAMCVASLCALAGAPREAGVLRGAVFYLNMALWGARRTPPHAAPHAVLPRLLQAVESGHDVVVYEVACGLAGWQRPLELHAAEWRLLLRLLAAIARKHMSSEPRNEKIHVALHSGISSVEQLLEAGQFRGDLDQLLQLLHMCAPDRPEASVQRMITLQFASLSPTNANWLGTALELCLRYIRAEPRRAVRDHAAAAFRDFVARHRVAYGDEVTERVVLPALGACAGDAEPSVRAAAARLLPALAALAPPHHLPDAAQLLEKILNRSFEVYAPSTSIPAEADLADAQAAVAGLLQLVRARMLASPGAHAARVLLILLEHVEQHYKRPHVLQQHPSLRSAILDMLCSLRVNSHNCVGLCFEGSGAVVCSPYLVVERCSARSAAPAPAPTPPPGGCVFPAGRAARALLAALAHERSWPVLARLLHALPAMLHERALAVPRRAQELQLVASTLCGLVSERNINLSGGTTGPPGAAGARPLVSELHAACLPALAALAPYHSYLEPSTQQLIVRCLLKHGMVLRNPAAYINALTIYTLEMRDTMVKMLPEVLLELSKITPTKIIAAPMLEFLSTLTRLPRVFASFVEDQYMSVFAILLPYTNPSRYPHYVVSLAHHVIAAWFLKCRLNYRRNFVRFIIHGLHNYIIKPFEEQLSRAPPPANEDSSSRQRSSSLGSRVRGAPGGGGVGGARLAAGGSQSAAFHVELTETCVDLLSRYTFTPCTVKPQRSDTAEFLFTGGQSMTWLVGHKLVTITTSGCLQNSIKQGLCDRCAVLCRQHADSAASPLPPVPPPHAPAAATQQSEESSSEASTKSSSTLQVQTNAPEIKRYSKSSLQHSRSLDVHSQCNDPAPATQGNAVTQQSPHSSRQNSSENSKSTDPLLEALNHFSERFEKVSKEVDGVEPGWSRGGALLAAGACPCWCGNWAELHVRSPTGDVAWLMRMQNQMNWESVMESPLQDVAALLMPVPPAPGPAGAAPAPAAAPGGVGPRGGDPTAAASNTYDKYDVRAEAMRARSGSANSQRRPPPPDLHKSSSDSVVPPRPAQPPQPPHQPLRTAPINIPGSPQRQSAAPAADDDDLLLVVPDGKSRHPVRRSNSSPEMSSSWKLPPRAPPAPPPPAPAPAPSLRDMLVLPSCEPTGSNPVSSGLLASKKANKKANDMRVSCEAIPEEMSGTSPHPPPHHPHHPHLATYKSDPGSASDAERPAGEHHLLQKTASDTTVSSSRSGGATVASNNAACTAGGHLVEELPPLARSKRSNTISVMSPTRRRREPALARAGSGAGGSGGVTPAFVFLQLYHNMSTYPTTPPVPGESATHLNPLMERPLRVSGDQHERTIKTLDLLPPLETYKIGVLYVGPGQQDDEVAILKNEYGSVRYSEFVRQLGTLVSLDEEQPNLFLNLERGGKDGHYTYVWHDDIMQVLFHVATAMPSRAGDPACNEKRKYIGNDYVSIVYNNSGADFNIHTIKGQFNVCIVVVEPLEHGLHRVLVKSKEAGGEAPAPPPPASVADANVALLARQRALHASLASQISASLSRGGAAFASNCLERLRAIKRLRRRCEAERLAAAARAPEPYAANELHARVAIDDFNDYT